MRWKGRRQSSNVEDRRGRRAGGAAIGGGFVLIIALIALLLGADPRQIGQLLQQQGQGPQAGGAAAPLNPAEEELKAFVSVVLADTEDVWNYLFREMGRAYREPTLVLFSGRVQSACGFASDAMGPFYCGADEKLYIDLSFYEDLKTRRRATSPRLT